MRTRSLGAALLLALASVGSADVGIGFEESVVASGLSSPTAVDFLPDGRMLVVELGGRLALVDAGVVTTLLDVPDVAFCSTSNFETGLLGIAVDPDFETTGHVFIYRTKSANQFNPCDALGRFNEVIRVAMAPDGTVSAASITTILTGIQSDTGYHNGGGLRFHGGKLFVGVGDTGAGDFKPLPPGGQTNPYAQDLGHLEGKILRIEKTGAVPADNPFVGKPGARGEVFAYGFRNPWRFGFDPVTGRLWAGDVGEGHVEEIDIVTAGGNYSWPHCEGNLPKSCRRAGEKAPVLTYGHEGNPPDGHASVTGGGFAPTLFGTFGGQYFFGDFLSGVISRVSLNAARSKVSGGAAAFVTGADGPVDIVFGPDGALYYVAINVGEVRRVGVPAGGDQVLPGKLLLLKDGTTKSIAVTVKAAVAQGGPSDDPTVVGASLTVDLDGVASTYALPAANWKLRGKASAPKGFQYADRQSLSGPITKVVVTTGKSITVVGKGALGHALGAAAPTDVDVILTLGERRFCMTFGGAVTFKAAKQLQAKNAPAPTQCPLN